MSGGPYSEAIRAIVSPVASFFDPRPPMVILNTSSDSSGANCPAPLPPVPPPEQFIEISFQDESTKQRLTAEDIATMAEAINIQLRDFSAKWRTALYQIIVYPRGEPVKGSFQLYFKDTTDVPGTYGYHFKTTDTEAKAYVFLETILGSASNGVLQRKTMAGSTVSIITSHEVLEMIGNPAVNQGVLAGMDVRAGYDYKLFKNDGTIQLLTEAQLRQMGIINNEFNKIFGNFLLEVADAVQANLVTVTARNKDVEVSDFVYLSWFNMDNLTGPYNFKKTLIAPFTLDLGGYHPVFTPQGLLHIYRSNSR